MWLRSVLCFSLLSFASLASHGAQPVQRSLSPDQSASVEWSCKDEYERECTIIVKSQRSGQKKISDKMRAPSVTWHGSNLAEITISCGSPCEYSWFFTPELGVSAPIEFVVAVAPSKMIAVSAGVDELEIVQIFGDIKKPLQTIKRDFFPAAALVSILSDVKFIDEDHLQFSYMASSDEYSKEPNPNVTERRHVTKKGAWLEKTEIVPINVK